MSMTPSELAALPTAPTLSRALTESARYADQGPIDALSRAVYGTTTPGDHLAVITPEHTIAWGLAIFATARRISVSVGEEWPDPSWDAGRCAETVEGAHRALTAWAAEHNPKQLAALFLDAAQETRLAEQ
jgi:hypothetical protein